VRIDHAHHRGSILIVTMFIVLAITAMVLVFSQESVIEARSAANEAAGQQADAIARGAMQYVIDKVKENEGTLLTDEDMPAEGVEVGSGFFWLIRPDYRNDEGVAFGVIDEAGKLNLNLVNDEILLKLPNMTNEAAASIIDWRDSDTEPLPDGAENDYYLSLDEPYYAKDNAYETIDELLFVRGCTRELVFGEDTNFNNILDDNENDRDASLPEDDGDSTLDRGFVDYLTVYTGGPNVNAEGDPRIFINQAAPDGLTELLEEKLTGNTQEIEDRILAARPYRNMMDFYFRSGLDAEQFAAVSDDITTIDSEQTVGQVNVNSAPEEVLAALPGLDENDASILIAARDNADVEDGQIGWVAEALGQEKASNIGDFITNRSYQYTVDVVAVSQYGRAFRRYRAVIDAAGEPPRILRFTDMTALGWPLDPDILEQVRNGEYASPTGR
jgi:type II secretory pathway component PulK